MLRAQCLKCETPLKYPLKSSHAFRRLSARDEPNSRGLVTRHGPGWVAWVLGALIVFWLAKVNILLTATATLTVCLMHILACIAKPAITIRQELPTYLRLLGFHWPAHRLGRLAVTWGEDLHLHRRVECAPLKTERRLLLAIGVVKVQY